MVVIKIDGKYILNRGGEPAGHLVKSLKEFKNKVIKENSNIKPIVVYDGNNYLLIGKDDLKEWVIPAYPTQELYDMSSLNYEAQILASEDVLNEYRTKINEISNNIQNSTEDVKLAGKDVLKDDANDVNLLYYLVVGAFAVSILLIVLIIKRRKRANL